MQGARVALPLVGTIGVNLNPKPTPGYFTLPRCPAL